MSRPFPASLNLSLVLVRYSLRRPGVGCSVCVKDLLQSSFIDFDLESWVPEDWEAVGVVQRADTPWGWGWGILALLWNSAPHFPPLHSNCAPSDCEEQDVCICIHLYVD